MVKSCEIHTHALTHSLNQSVRPKIGEIYTQSITLNPPDRQSVSQCRCWYPYRYAQHSLVMQWCRVRIRHIESTMVLPSYIVMNPLNGIFKSFIWHTSINSQSNIDWHSKYGHTRAGEVIFVHRAHGFQRDCIKGNWTLIFYNFSIL